MLATPLLRKLAGDAFAPVLDLHAGGIFADDAEVDLFLRTALVKLEGMSVVAHDGLAVFGDIR